MPNTTDSWDHLQLLTKSEIIEFLKTKSPHLCRQPPLHAVKHFKYEKENRRLMQEMDANIAKSKSAEFTAMIKRIDTLAQEFNAETDVGRKIKLFNKRKKLMDKMMQHYKEFDVINKKLDANDRKYNL